MEILGAIWYVLELILMVCDLLHFLWMFLVEMPKAVFEFFRK